MVPRAVYTKKEKRMWIYIAGAHTAFNLDHAARVFVEDTGSGAALKADLTGKTQMLQYFTSKADAQAALETIMARRDAGAQVLRL